MDGSEKLGSENGSAASNSSNFVPQGTRAEQPIHTWHSGLGRLASGWPFSPGMSADVCLPCTKNSSDISSMENLDVITIEPDAQCSAAADAEG